MTNFVKRHDCHFKVIFADQYPATLGSHTTWNVCLPLIKRGLFTKKIYDWEFRRRDIKGRAWYWAS